MTRIGLIQMQSEKGAIAKNLETMACCLEEAALKGVDIIGFPEMCLTGYADPAKYPQAVIALDGPEINGLLKLSKGYPATVLAGLIEANPFGKPFITQIVIRQGVMQGTYRKITIKDQEAEWFSAGQDVPVFQCDGLVFGMAICADISNETVFANLGRQGAKIVFELAAPGLYGDQAVRNWQTGYAWWEGECQKYLSRYAKAYGFWIGAATQAGRTVDEDFPGGGYLFAPTGERLFTTKDWSPRAVYLDLDFETRRVREI